MGNEQLVILNKKKGTIKGQIANFKNFLAKYREEEPDAIKLGLHLQRLKNTFEKFDDIQDQIELLDTETSHIDLVLDHYAIQDDYLKLWRTTKRRVKLPLATLPTFSGRYEEWLNFRDSFISLIHDQTDLTNLEKLQEKQTSEGLIKLAEDAQQHMLSLASLGVKISEEILVQNIEEKLHKTTLEKWDETLKRNEFPKLDDMLEFLYRTATRLSQCESQNKSLSKDTSSTPGSSGNQRNAKTAFLTSTIKPCPACRCKTHPLFRCEKFRSFSIPTRIQVVQDASLCPNCIRFNHKLEEYKFGNSGRYISLTTKIPMNQLITSAVLYSLDKERRPIRCQALLDTCSSANFITEKLATALRLPKKRCSVPVGALNNLTKVAKAVVKITIRSLHSSYERPLNFLTIPQIAELVPNDIIPREVIKIPPNIQLADPTFHLPSKVDMLLGSGRSLSMFCGGQIILSDRAGDLILQKTELGWIAGGNVNSMSLTISRAIKCNFAELRSDISKFWELEEGFSQIHLSPEEIACEEHFRIHKTRNNLGRCIVALLFRQNHERLGESRSVALKRLNSLERRFKHQPELRSQYSDIIEEYLTLGHISPIQDQGEFGFYLPHHAVFKEDSSTTRVRVVFDGSAKSESGFSLNNTLMVGPTLQDDILSHILRFRFHIFVLKGDIEKIYRQFEIRDEDRRFQRILWRRDGINLDSLQLNTVTFGISSSPFLATRAIEQLINDEGHQHPKAAIVLETDLYVDDLITRAETVEEEVQTQDSVIKLLNLGCLNKRQWALNDINCLRGIPDTSINKKIQLNDGKTLKTLGVSWNSSTDSIIYSVHSPVLKSKITKRTVLSEIAKLFDPPGLLGPIILFARIIMQKLWELKVDWHESLPNNIHKTWVEFHSEITLLSDLRFERKVIVNEAIDVQLHGFCNASEKGYGACIYIKSKNSQGYSETKLLCAKSRVAPLKTINITHLELCGAELLAKLYSTVHKAINVSIKKTVFWTDSTIVYFWINKSPHHLETFIANRVSQIQQKTKTQDWRHVRTNYNPADALSRGQTPVKFIKYDLWKFGPDWLNREESTWPTIDIPSSNKFPGLKKEFCLNTLPNLEFFNKFYSFSRLKRIVAYCLRLKSENSQRGLLRASEINNTERAIIRETQITHFAEEMNDLKIGRRVHKKSKLTSLDPFIDRDGIIRVGGRLKNSFMPQSQQHPMVLPRSSHITGIIILNEHLENKHAGIQATLHAKKFRNRSRVKVHVVIFICLIVKAVHLEVVSDMTTEGFLAALRRFTARRERPSVIYSDNRSNFIGFLTSLVTKGLNGDSFAIEVEAFLNSCPLTPISCDPIDMLALTPGHFIIGHSLTNLPEVDLTSASPSASARWLHIQKMRQHFWRRWHKEYLNELNIRHK
ncbi:uncharacterized protein LOC117170053 [Belonocnema kinseyi]|uniref:uncharacterized protein LOC117170053 n=1 Tax=Belonocnema kinseyi TaxID=2817044 RepID=UPI00143DDD93|nr:uncharacterized protein LOC117170053 [Belonocnema kinseyi]